MTTDDPADRDQDRRLTVTHGRHGWEVMELRNDQVIRRVNYTDWHRVERAVGRFDLSRETRVLLEDAAADQDRG